MNYFSLDCLCRSVAWLLRRKVAVLASVLTGVEAVVQYGGVTMPYSGTIQPWMRVAAIIALSGFAFYFRWQASKEQDVG